VHYFRLPRTQIVASNIVLGMMRIRDLEDAAIRLLVGSARDAGVTMFDHADIYGGERHLCERRFGDAGAVPPAERDRVTLQSKVGIRPGRYDFSADHIRTTVDETLEALRTDYLDLLLLHRPDTLVEPDEVAAAFDALAAGGKVRQFGVSNHTPGQIELLRLSVTQPLVVNQVQLSIVHAPLIATGIAANMATVAQSIDRDNGLLDYSRTHGMTLQAWSPFQRPAVDGSFIGDREQFGALNDVLERLAERYGVSVEAIAVAWITRHPAQMQVVLGTTSAEHLRSSAAGSDLDLTREEWYELFRAGGHIVP